jgi:DNA repair protein RadC
MRRIPKISLRVLREDSVPYSGDQISGSIHAAEILIPLMAGLDRESVWLLCLDTKNQPIAVSMISLGTLDASYCSPREIFKTALLCNARGIIVAHNHPSGSLDPSADDRAVTNRLAEAARLMDIRLSDHMIIAEERYFSFRDGGLMP